MTSFKQLLDQVAAIDPLHGKKVKNDLSEMDAAFYEKADAFLQRVEQYLQQQNHDLNYGIDCYFKMITDVRSETKHFVRTGEYTSKSFEEVNARVYNNPDVMTYYMNGLLLSQFLWAHHYSILTYFIDNLAAMAGKASNYLEMGGGHGLYISEAIRLLGNDCSFEVIDISPTSIAASRELIRNDKVKFTLSNIFDVADEQRYDFITMGEVMEHVEDPTALLRKLGALLKDDGKMFITTPTNAPAIDHIFLFKNAADIREVIHAAGFKVVDERCFYSEKVSPERAEKFKVAMMYAAFIEKI